MIINEFVIINHHKSLIPFPSWKHNGNTWGVQSRPYGDELKPLGESLGTAKGRNEIGGLAVHTTHGIFT